MFCYAIETKELPELSTRNLTCTDFVRLRTDGHQVVDELGFGRGRFVVVEGVVQPAVDAGPASGVALRQCDRAASPRPTFELRHAEHDVPQLAPQQVGIGGTGRPRALQHSLADGQITKLRHCVLVRE